MPVLLNTTQIRSVERVVFPDVIAGQPFFFEIKEGRLVPQCGVGEDLRVAREGRRHNAILIIIERVILLHEMAISENEEASLAIISRAVVAQDVIASRDVKAITAVIARGIIS